MRMLVNEEMARACGGRSLPPDAGARYDIDNLPPTGVSPGGGTGYLHDRWKALQARLELVVVSG